MTPTSDLLWRRQKCRDIVTAKDAEWMHHRSKTHKLDELEARMLSRKAPSEPQDQSVKPSAKLTGIVPHPVEAGVHDSGSVRPFDLELDDYDESALARVGVLHGCRMVCWMHVACLVQVCRTLGYC